MNILESKIICNNCMKEFYESEILYDKEENKEYCPNCGASGCLMDLNDNDFLEDLRMEQQEHWHLYRKDDPNTWPEIDCPMLVCRWFNDTFYELKIMYWEQDKRQFYYANHSMERYYCEEDELYYLYVGYIPNGYKAIKIKKCGVWSDTRCQYADDGYCFDLPRHLNCKHIVEVTEYSLNDNQRIWKEFE